MQIEFIDITSFRGLSSEAEHFYAAIGEPSWVQEALLSDPGCTPNRGVNFINTKKLRHYPSREEAEAMWEKDNHWNQNPFVKEHREDTILDLMEDGTQRFPSIETIIKAARKKFPDSYLCFSFSGSVKEFNRLFVKTLGEKKSELSDEMVSLINQNDRKHRDQSTSTTSEETKS